jgi:carbohydrate-selective porin OprB
MKKTLLIAALLCCNISFLSAQDLEGKKIYSGNISLSFTNDFYESKLSTATLKNSYLTTNLNFLTGRIKKNNSYIAYGATLGIRSQIEDENTFKQYSLGPAVQLGKFVKVFNQFYLAPKSTFSLAGVWGSSVSDNLESIISGATAGINVSPLNFVYQVKNNLMLNLSLGQLDLTYSYFRADNDNYTQNSHELNITGNISNYTGFGVLYLF